jgi:methyl-accepting chemotaxis protein
VNSKSLKRTFLVFMLPFVAGVFALNLISSYFQQQTYLRSEFLHRGQSLTENLAYNCQNLLSSADRDINFAYKWVDSLMKEPDIRWAAVLDPEGRVLAQNGASDMNFNAGRHLDLSLPGLTVRRFTQTNGEEVYDLEAPIFGSGTNSGNKLGTVHVGMSVQSLKNTQRNIMLQLLVIFLVCFGLCFLVANYFGYLIIDPINRLVNMMKDIASKKADLTRRMDLERDDELGELGRWFNYFIESIQGIAKKSVELIDQMTTSLEELSSTAQELNATADEINTTVQSFTHDLQKQEEETTATTATADRVAGALVQITSQAQDSSRIFEETKNVSRHGGETVQESVTKINGIADNMNVIEERMKHLSGSLADIAGFVETIQGIASQTNLLSLNAAIEAARAGEAGRGFSVVAEEVRKLAENASNASQQIQSLITQIQTETRETGEATRWGVQAVQSGRDTIHLAGGALEEIMKTANQSANISLEISRSLTQQLEALKDMMQRVRTVQTLGKNNFTAGQTMAASVQEQTASLEQVTTAIQRLTEDALRVKDTVVDFAVQ